MAGRVTERAAFKSSVYPVGPLIWDKGQTRSLEHNYLEGFHQQKDFFRGAFGWDRLR